MSKPFDASLKELLFTYPTDWLTFLGLPLSGGVEIIDSDVSTVTAATDKVIRVQGSPPWLLHAELQSSPRSNPAEPLHWYNTLLRHRHNQQVRTFLVLLRQAANSPQLTGLYQEAFPNEEPYLVFRYHVLRLWEVPVDNILAGGLGTLPLAPLAQVAEHNLPGVIERMNRRVQSEASPDAAGVLWAATYVLMGLRYPEPMAAQLLQRVRNMEDSVTYQAILTRGGIRELQKVLLLLGRKRFGPPTAQTTATLESLTDLNRLEQLSERLLDVTSWEELLAQP